MDSDRIIGQVEAARMLGMSPLNLYRLVRDGRIPHVEVEGRGGGVKRRLTQGKVRKLRLSDVQAFEARFPKGSKRRHYKPIGPPSPPDPRASLFDKGGFIRGTDAARLCGVSVVTITLWLKKGILVGEMVPSRDGSPIRRIRRSTVEAFIAAGMPRPPLGGPKGPRGPIKMPGLGCGDIARRLGVSDYFVSKWLEQGLLPSFLHGKRRRVTPEALEAFIASRRPTEE
jgi:excisionase family DNA binding protein